MPGAVGLTPIIDPWQLMPNAAQPRSRQRIVWSFSPLGGGPVDVLVGRFDVASFAMDAADINQYFPTEAADDGCHSLLRIDLKSHP